LFSSGRGGVQTAQYGGTPEQFAYEQARQEAMSRANVGARQQSQAEQLQAAELGGVLQSAGYQPQQQALSLLEGSQIPAGFLSLGQRTGAELQAKSEQSGLEGYLQAAQLGQNERLAQLESMASLIGGGGQGANATSGLLGGLDQYLPDWLTSSLGGGTSNYLAAPETASSSFLGGNGFLSSLAAPQTITPSGFNQTAFNAALYAPQQNIDASGFNQSAFNDALGL